MKLEEQVLSIEQVRELQELGLDVNKYASMAWVEQIPFLDIECPIKYELEVLTDSLIGNRGCLEVIPTLTIGDIIEILPERIAPIYYLEISKNLVDYCSNDKSINGEVEERLIDALFQTLKWCIKEKHIAL